MKAKDGYKLPPTFTAASLGKDLQKSTWDSSLSDSLRTPLLIFYQPSAMQLEEMAIVHEAWGLGWVGSALSPKMVVSEFERGWAQISPEKVAGADFLLVHQVVVYQRLHWPVEKCRTAFVTCLHTITSHERSADCQEEERGRAVLLYKTARPVL
jgi:hypothetical protein